MNFQFVNDATSSSLSKIQRRNILPVVLAVTTLWSFIAIHARAGDRAIARPIWIMTVHGTAGWDYELYKQESYKSPDFLWAHYLATSNGPVEFVDWNTKSHFGAYSVRPKRISGTGEFIQPALTGRQRMVIEFESDYTNLVSITRAFNSLDFSPWRTVTNVPGKTSIIDDDFLESVPMPWQSGLTSTNRSRLYRVVWSKL